MSKLVTQRINRRKVLQLFGIYELRHADAHLARSDLDDAFALVHVDRTLPFVFQGYRLIDCCVSSLFAILEVLRPSISAK
jgi:hypothetical protein